NYDRKSIITSNEVLMLDTLPKEIAIYGDGAIGLEMASFFATAGTQVTLIYRHDVIQPHAHPLIQEGLIKQLDFLGIKRLEEKDIQTATKDDKGVAVSFKDGQTLHFPLLLIAVGRLPNKEVVACEAIEVGRGITTNEWYETTVKDHYAIGDCNGKIQLAHAARAQALNVTHTILGNQPKVLNHDHVVKFIHTLPMSYALVGKSASELKDAGVDFQESLVTLNQFTYSAYNHASKGVMLTYADHQGKVLGSEIFAPNAEELIATVAITLAGDVNVKQAASTILAHPTFSEALERTFYKFK
ncbi:MAG: FAD-dependent oxidoreductase, partial [Thiovulaceae bacterium]|nr:FAD-dependent oxidoreductase [Sulfurimonadaceae bacterium]